MNAVVEKYVESELIRQEQPKRKQRPYLLHMFNATKNVSPFDVNMAFEADINAVIPYVDVKLEDIYALTQDTIFSRGPEGVKRTGIFIGGRDFASAMEMLKRAKAAMVPPFEVSVFADPSGAVTTAAAMVACVEYWYKQKTARHLDGANVQIIGGTGPVGACMGVIAADCGADVSLVSNQGMALAQEIAEEYNGRYGVNMKGRENCSDEAIEGFMRKADIVIGAASAGVCVLTGKQLSWGEKLAVAADANAVPPLGIQGIEVSDMGRVLEDTPAQTLAIGALAIGNIKYKVHRHLFQIMTQSKRPVYLDHQAAFQVARDIVFAEFQKKRAQMHVPELSL